MHVSVITDQRKTIFYKKLLCHNNVIHYIMRKLQLLMNYKDFRHYTV